MIDLFLDWVDRLIYPAILLGVTLAVLFAAHRLRRLGEGRVGGLWLLLSLGCLGMGGLSPLWRDFLLAPERLPATLLLLLAPMVAWFSSPKDEATRLLEPLPETREHRLVDGGEVWVVASTLIVVLVLAWCFEPPLGPPLEPPLEASKLPWFLAGWQEMRGVVRPWMSWLSWPLLFGSLLVLPYLEPSGEVEAEEASRREATRVFLFFGVVLGWVPMIVGVYLRDARWQLVGLFGPRQDVPSTVSLAEAVWQRGFGMASPANGWWRELPGILLVIGYISCLLVVLPRWRASRGLWRRYRKHLGDFRYRLALGIFLLLGWVPLKMLLYWLFGIDDWVTAPWSGGGP